MSEPNIRVSPDAASLVAEVAEKIIALARQTQDAGSMFSFFLSGGSTPKALYQLLSSDAHQHRIDWRGVEIYFGDERCVPPEDDRSNYKMALSTLIDRVPIPRDNVYRMKGEIDPETAAKEYGLLLKERFQDEGPDALLLGVAVSRHRGTRRDAASLCGESRAARLHPGGNELAHHAHLSVHQPLETGADSRHRFEQSRSHQRSAGRPGRFRSIAHPKGEARDRRADVVSGQRGGGNVGVRVAGQIFRSESSLGLDFRASPATFSRCEPIRQPQASCAEARHAGTQHQTNL
jgi:hypothetical protein